MHLAGGFIEDTLFGGKICLLVAIGISDDIREFNDIAQDIGLVSFDIPGLFTAKAVKRPGISKETRPISWAISLNSRISSLMPMATSKQILPPNKVSSIKPPARCISNAMS